MNRNDWFGVISGQVAFDRDISPAAFRVYGVLVMYRNRDDDTCYPSNATVAEHTGQSLATVKRAIGELVERGVISRLDQFNDGRQTVSLTVLRDGAGEPAGSQS